MANKNDNYWHDPGSWKLGAIYYCAQDPRIVVPKRRKWAGWTFNYAHTGAYALTVAVLAIAVIPAAYFAAHNQITYMFYAIVGSTAVDSLLVFYCAQIGRD